MKKPCNACPFRKRALAGWLGPWKPWELDLHLMRGEAFPCHKTIHEDNAGMPDPLADPRLKPCAGAAIYLNNRVSLSRDASLAALQRALAAQPDYAALAESVFATGAEFVGHHNASPVKSWELLP